MTMSEPSTGVLGVTPWSTARAKRSTSYFSRVFSLCFSIFFKTQNITKCRERYHRDALDTGATLLKIIAVPHDSTQMLGDSMKNGAIICCNLLFLYIHV